MHESERQREVERFRDLAAFVDHVTTQRTTVPKDRFIIEMARGHSVLDLGCIDHDHRTALDLGDRWLHRQMKEVATEVVGVDILADDALELNRRGYDIVVGDVEQLDLGRTFDLVVAGDLIEHLSNIGSFLEAVSRHLGPDSLFVITTPNPFNVEQFAQALFRNQVMANPEHTVWLDPRVLHQLVARSPLDIAAFQWIDTRFHFVLRGGRVVRRIVNPLSEWIMRVRPICRRDFALVLTRSC